jgi:hypothetical protein
MSASNPTSEAANPKKDSSAAIRMTENGKLRIKLVVVLVATAVVTALLALNVDGINGPTFWHWPWRPIPAGRVFLAMGIASVPFFLALLLDGPGRARRSVAIVLLMISCYALKIASVIYRDDVTPADSPNLQLIQIIVENKDATSYYTDAAAFSGFPLRHWVTLYPELMPRLNLHSKSKPPGPIFYWWSLIKLMGAGPRTALVGGLLVGAICTLSIPATYLLLKRLLNAEQAAFCGASFLTLCPGFVLFFPYLDPAYILLSAALIGLWLCGLSDGRARWAVMLGAMLAITLLVTFNVLVIGLFMAGLPLVMRGEPLGRRLVRSIKQGAIALMTMGVLLTLLWITVGYDPVATFRSAWVNQHDLLRQYADQRPWPRTIPWDLVDFALGSGWISVVLVFFWIVGRKDELTRAEGGGQKAEVDTRPAPTLSPGVDGFHPSAFMLQPSALVHLALFQLVAVAVLGLLQLETARVWNFMLPLLMIPVGLELSRWPRGARLVPYGCLILVMAAICQNVKFVY